MTCNTCNYIFRVLSRNIFEEGGSFITDIHVRTCTTLSRLVYHTQAVLIYAAPLLVQRCHYLYYWQNSQNIPSTSTFNNQENSPMSPIMLYTFLCIYIYMCINSPHPQLVYGYYVLINTFYLLLIYYSKYFYNYYFGELKTLLSSKRSYNPLSCTCTFPEL